MLVDVLLLLLTTLSCEAQNRKVLGLEKNVYKRGINHSERAEFLYWHNYYRRQVETPRAADMIYLLYHKELETAAFDWAVKCNFQHGNFNFTRYQLDPAINIGQNIAVLSGAYNIKNAVFRWFEEYSDYNYEDKSCKPGAKCGHYLQVAGAVVTHMGCAVVYCPTYINSKSIKEDAYNIVCNYYPSALRAKWEWKSNMLVREKLSIYEQGQPCTACPDGYKVCEDKLCRSSPICLTLDNQCKNPSNTTTCLCDASVYPVYHDSGPSPSFTQSSAKQTTVSVTESFTSTTADLPIPKSTKTVTAQVTSTETSTFKSTETSTFESIETSAFESTETSTFESTGGSSLQSLTTTSQILHEMTTKISEATSTETVKQISSTQSTRTESETHEIYTSENTKQIIVTQTTGNDETTSPKTTDAENRQHEMTTSTTVVPEITTIAASPHITTIAAATSSDHFGSGDNITTAYQEPFSPEAIQHMCFIKISTRYLTQNDMLPKDPGVIGDELFQKRWRQIQRRPKISLQVMERVDSRAVPFGLLSVTMQCYHFMVSVTACLILRALGCI